MLGSWWIHQNFILDDAQVEALSKASCKEELLVKLLFLLQAPALNWWTLNEVPPSLSNPCCRARQQRRPCLKKRLLASVTIWEPIYLHQIEEQPYTRNHNRSNQRTSS